MYSKAFRALMIQKMTDPERPAAQSLADEIGVSVSVNPAHLVERATIG